MRFGACGVRSIFSFVQKMVAKLARQNSHSSDIHSVLMFMAKVAACKHKKVGITRKIKKN